MQPRELAFNILEWPEDADLSEHNLMYNFTQTFYRNFQKMPDSIICRPDQANWLFQQFPPHWEPGDQFQSIRVRALLITVVIVPKGSQRDFINLLKEGK